ncbi:MAG TPA: FAD-dependent monooxygenase, partial [Pseudoxanthomonas sp.]|nr:FAD-dependent monooxygenase [Pseudoxanthomonas sp.]
MEHDVAIVGAGPVGLCLARALGLQGLRVAL